MRYYFLLLISISAIISSCVGGVNDAASADGDTIPFKYARNLTMIDHADYTEAIIRNPWDSTKTLHTYILVKEGHESPANTPEGTKIQLPLHNALVYSSVHCSLIQRLGAIEQIGGVCDAQYIMIDDIKRALSDGKMTDAGSSLDPDIEKVIDMSPDAIMLSPFENSNGYGAIEKIGTPIVECADYMEVSALARAEWMILYGTLFGQRDKAQEMFADIERQYNELIQPIDESSPTVVVDLKTGGTWYAPGGNSTIGMLLHDAGAKYIFADREESGSLQLAPEYVFDKGQDCDFWLIKYSQDTDKTYDELSTEYAPYSRMKAFRQHNIYGCNTSHTLFYEESPFQPHLLLKDLVKVFHPDVLPDYKPRYYKKL